ncbi:hypothetical protein [Marinimicrobium sp. C2-29]|uniref:hypothetical protein n=1 Tax=Marinimicrobium sp. C2-29 TaxID=3139825 RepID=UPI003138ED89
MMTQLLTIWSDSPALSLAIWLAILVIVLYLGRSHAHQLFRATGRAIHGSMRLASRSISQLEQRLSARNRDVLLAMGRREVEEAIERDFNRVYDIMERDLSRYPKLHRRIADAIEKIEEDYQEASDTPPLPPAWSEVVETVSALPGSSDPAVHKVLDNIREVIEDAHRETVKLYQKSSRDRHRVLAGMQPQWRALDQNMGKVKQTIDGLEERSQTIDKQMQEYASIRAGEEQALNSLTASSLTQFLIAGLVLFVALLGGLINFHLIAMPMSEMVGGTSYIGSMRTSDIAALVIILVEVAMGVFLLESLRITHLFPMIGRMDDRMRRRMMIASLTILTLLASIEASLAYMRDLLALDREALNQTLAGTAVVEAQFRWIPSIGQMMLGFILPFALAFVAIPLESFIHSLRTVLGLITLGLLRALRLVVRMVGGFANHLSKMLVHFYDMLIVVPLGIEQLVRNHSGKSKPEKPEAESVPWDDDELVGKSAEVKS